MKCFGKSAQRAEFEQNHFKNLYNLKLFRGFSNNAVNVTTVSTVVPMEVRYKVFRGFSSWESRDSEQPRSFASHQCGLGSIPGPKVISGLSWLLVLARPKVFLQVVQFSSLHKNQRFRWE